MECCMVAYINKLLQVEVISFGLLESFMMVNLHTIKSQVKAPTHGQMDQYTQVL